MKLYTEEQVRSIIQKSRSNEDKWYSDNYLLAEQTPIELPSKTNIKEKLFDLANEFAVSGYGKTAVILHTIHNGLDNNDKQ
jgi:hypothetical protein